MRRLLFLLFLMMVMTPSHAAEKRRYPLDPPEVVKINERVYALLGPLELPTRFNQGYMANSTVIIGDKGVILIDTGFSDEIGEHLKQAVAKITPKPVTHVINTHHHGDHVLGNIAFKGATIISSEQCKKLVDETGLEWLAFLEEATQRKFPNTKPVAATVTYAQETLTELVVDGVRLVLWVPKGSHTLGDMMVYLPVEKVLVSGDILVQHITPNFQDGVVKDWVETLSQVVSLNPKTIVPGHGLLMTSVDAAAMQRRMAGLYAGVEAGYKKGLSDSEIRKTLDLEEWGKMHFFIDLMGGNINRTFLEIEAEKF
jgi:glyoxylase-like metal-dependent hydrolase (beta-lactamase superfamily II)